MASEISGMLNSYLRVRIIHVFRSANQVADHMAKIGATQVEAEHLWDSPLHAVRDFLCINVTT